MGATLDFDNPVFRGFAFYAVIVVAKMMFLSWLTVIYRMTKKVYANPEDSNNPFDDGKPKECKFNDPDVERVRRNHLNDLENIPVFLVISLLYILTNPSPNVALWHFRVFVGGRILHTLAYQMGLQPWRGIGFGVGFMTTVSMGVQVLMFAIA